jgi:superfamily II DNA helicase RecQ
VSLVIQVLAPVDVETLSQRGGRAGRDKSMTAEVVLMAQDSMHEDSREGQKRLLKMIKKEEANTPGASSKKAAKKSTKKATEEVKNMFTQSKGKRNAREYTKPILDFINTPGCRIKILDKEFDNPPRPESDDAICLCDNCRHSRGELTFRERLKVL